MRISQFTPFWERVFPPGHSGIELIVAPLIDKLVCRGHEVTLFTPVQEYKAEDTYAEGLENISK